MKFLLANIVCLFFIYGCASSNTEQNLQFFKWHDFEKKSNGSYMSIDESKFITKNFEQNIEKKAFVGDPIIEFGVGTKKTKKEIIIKKFIAINDIKDTRIKKGNSYDFDGIDSKSNAYYIKATEHEYIKVDKNGNILSDSLIFSTGREYKKIFDNIGLKIFSTDENKTNIINDEFSKDSIRQELIYNGKSGSEIKVLYREFKEDMIRPAFTQVMQYDLKDSNFIRFKNFKIQVINANNEFIKYKVIEF